jgi:hypothetical protein
MLAYAFLSGLFFGIYIAVDLLLVSLVLPDKENEGRDMAIQTIGAAGPQIAAPLLAAVVVKTAGFGVLCAIGAALAILGGVITLRIKSIR